MTDNTVDLDAKRKEKNRCVYCGSDPHPVVLACPRIAALVINPEGYVEGIEFVQDWGKPVAGD
jgi:hypothetical protein